MDVLRRFMEVDGRLVHYRTRGAGPPVLLLHDTPGSSRQMEPVLLAVAAQGYRVLAPDLAGTALTDLADDAQESLEALARWLARVLDAFGLDRVHVAGRGAGAVLALVLATADPQRVGGLALADLPRRDEAERRERRTREFPVFPPRPDGSHLVAAWSVARRRYLYTPWYAGDAAQRLHRTVPDPETLHGQVIDALRAGERYGAFGTAALDVDVGPLLQAATQRFAKRLVSTGEDLAAATVSAAGRGPHLREAGPLPAQPVARGGAISRRYVDTSFGQVHVLQTAGNDAGLRPPLLLIHQSPGTAAAVEPLLRALAPGRVVLAPDHLGNGDSDPPATTTTDIAFYTDVLDEVLGGLGHERVDVWGSHTGSLIGLELALRHPRRVRRLVMDGITLFDRAETEDILAHYFVPTEPDPYGLHLLRTWNVRLDMYLFWPWYRHTADAANDYPMPPAERIHAWVMDMLTTGPTWHVAYRAAFSYPTAERLPLLDTPALLVAGPTDPLRRFNASAAALRPGLATATTAGTATADALASTAGIIRSFLDETAVP
jgi:pimeloyl-ACP methyl ester carboxylesterase